MSGPGPKPIELVLAQRANDAIAAGKDPAAVTERLHLMLKHLSANPDAANSAQDALNRGVDPGEIESRTWDLAQQGAMTAQSDATAARPNVPRTPYPHDVLTDVAGAVYKTVQGGSLGLGKYAAAAGAELNNRLHGGKLPYGAALDQVEDLGREYDYNHPALSTVANLAGGVATARYLPTLAGKVAQIANPVGRLAAGAGVNAAENALYGGTAAALSQDGGVQDRAKAFTSGAESGALTGAVIGTAGRLGEMGLNATARPSENRFMGRLLGNYVTPIEDKARGAILDNIRRGNSSVGNLIADAQTAGEAPASLATMNNGTARMARGIVARPGQGSTQIVDDLQGARRQLPGFMRDETRLAAGVNAVPAEALANSHAFLAKAKAAPLYEKAYQTAPIDDPTLLSAFQDDDFRRAYNTGRRIAAKEPKPVALPPLEDILAGKTGMPVQGFDYAKQGLDDVIEGRMTNGKMGKREARALRVKLSGVLGEVDQMRPEYAAARDTFRGEKELEDAATVGGDFLGMDDRQVRQTLLGFGSTGEQEAFRSAALDKVMQVYRSSDNPGTMLNKVFGSDIKRQALRALIGGDPKYLVLKQALDQAGSINSRANYVIGGSGIGASPTASIEADKADLTDAALPALAAAGRGDAAGVLMPFLRRSANRMFKGETERFGETAAPMLTAGSQGGIAGQQARLGILNDVQESQSRSLLRNTRDAQLARAGAQVAGQHYGTSDQHSLLSPLPQQGLPPDYLERAKADPAYRAYLQRNGVPVP